MTTPEWCDDHWQTLPCAGCRADELVAHGLPKPETHVTDVRKRAAGDDD
jgi:hypothetical protein